MPFGDEVVIGTAEKNPRSPISALATGKFTMPASIWHEVRIVNDTRQICVYVNGESIPVVVGPSHSAQAMNHRVAFYNRESVGRVNKHSRIADLTVNALQD